MARIWRVVGGQERGGIVVRLGPEPSSPLADARLATAALVRELALEGGRLRYELLAGEGPPTGWASLRLASGKELLSAASDVWEVVGGAEKGGVLVRTAEDVASPLVEERLAARALVRELELRGDRLRYERLAGRGPASGWVSVRLAGGRELLRRTAEGAEGADVAEGADGAGGAIAGGGAGDAEPAAVPALFAAVAPEALPQATLLSVVEAELSTPLCDFWPAYAEGLLRVAAAPAMADRRRSEEEPCYDADFELRRAEVEARRFRGEAKRDAPAAPPPFVRLGKQDLMRLAPQAFPGDIYGLPVPPTLGELEAWGADWLTRALRTAGTLPKDDEVVAVRSFRRLPTTTASAAGGAGPKAILQVAYAKSSSLHTELFVKMPWAVSGGSKEDGVDYNNRISASDEYPEQAVYRFMAPSCPFKVPKYYFADVSRKNGNSVLIIEAIRFGERGQTSFEAYETLPLCQKYFDHQLEPRMQVDIYYCVMRAQARLAAWYKLGFFDSVPGEATGGTFQLPRLGSFPWPPRLSERQREGKRRSGTLLAGFWRELLCERGRHCFPLDLTEEPFVRAVEACVRDAAGQADDVRLYFNLFPDFIALQHPNLNVDNAFFWRTAAGGLDCGIFDWGSASPANVVQLMTGSLTGAEGYVQDEHDVALLRCFRDEYHRECGLRLDLGEMQRQWHLTYGLYLVFLAMRFTDAVFVRTPRDEWATIGSLWDKRVIDRWEVRCYTFMAGLALRYLHLRWTRAGRQRLHLHDTLLEWREYWASQGMT